VSRIFKYSDSNKRYHAYDYYNRKKYGKRMFKLPISISVTCPNRDGTKGIGGCDFCSANGSGNGLNFLSVREQIAYQRKILEDKGRVGGYIAYFQSFTNTYGDIEYLRKSYLEAIECGVEGVIIATRADSIDGGVIDVLCDIDKRTELIVELGLESVHDKTLCDINRGETYGEFLSGYSMIKAKNIKTGVHIIYSLPYETYDDMFETAKEVARLSPDFLKIHALHILKGTRLAKRYEEERFPLLSREEYVSLVADTLEILPDTTVIERLTGDGARGEVIAPLWTTDKLKNLNGIDKELVRRESYQGKYYRRDE